MHSVLRNSEKAGLAEAKYVWQVNGRRQGKSGGKKEVGRVQATVKAAAWGLPKLIP